MLTGLPQLAVLRAFEAAVRHGSFTRAAEELGLTQGAVSHHVKGLEVLVGAALFERGARGVSVTREGAQLAAAVRDGLGRVTEALALLRRASESRRVVVAALPGFVVKWLFPRLHRFDERCPDIDVDVLATAGDDLALREADVAILYGAIWPVPAGAERLIDEVMAPVCSPRLALGALPLNGAADLRRHVLLHDEVRGDARDRVGWRHWLAAAGFADLRPAHERRFGQANMVVDAAVEGRGVALGRNALIGLELAAGRLVVPFGPVVTTGLAYWLVPAPATRERASVAAFVAWLREEAAASAADAALMRRLAGERAGAAPDIDGTGGTERAGGG